MPRLVPNSGNDNVYTPSNLANFCIDKCQLNKSDKVLEPCCGEGAFLDILRLKSNSVEWCEISKGVDFLKHDKRYDWIITNPPWSIFRSFLNHSMLLSNQMGFLITYNHLNTKARIRDMINQGFWVSDVWLIDTPKEFPQSGFQLVFAIIRKTSVLQTTFHKTGG
jgi:hypothetical protein